MDPINNPENKARIQRQEDLHRQMASDPDFVFRLSVDKQLQGLADLKCQVDRETLQLKSSNNRLMEEVSFLKEQRQSQQQKIDQLEETARLLFDAANSNTQQIVTLTNVVRLLQNQLNDVQSSVSSQESLAGSIDQTFTPVAPPKKRSDQFNQSAQKKRRPDFIEPNQYSK